MGRLFQEFLVEFLKVEQQVFTDVRAPQVPGISTAMTAASYRR